jgi:hypothetical protein
VCSILCQLCGFLFSLALGCSGDILYTCLCISVAFVGEAAHVCASKSCAAFASYEADPKRAHAIVSELCWSNMADAPATVSAEYSLNGMEVMNSTIIKRILISTLPDGTKVATGVELASDQMLSAKRESSSQLGPSGRRDSSCFPASFQ